MATYKTKREGSFQISVSAAVTCFCGRGTSSNQHSSWQPQNGQCEQTFIGHSGVAALSPKKWFFKKKPLKYFARRDLPCLARPSIPFVRLDRKSWGLDLCGGMNPRQLKSLLWPKRQSRGKHALIPNQWALVTLWRPRKKLRLRFSQ